MSRSCTCLSWVEHLFSFTNHQQADTSSTLLAFSSYWVRERISEKKKKKKVKMMMMMMNSKREEQVKEVAFMFLGFVDWVALFFAFNFCFSSIRFDWDFIFFLYVFALRVARRLVFFFSFLFRNIIYIKDKFFAYKTKKLIN